MKSLRVPFLFFTALIAVLLFGQPVWATIVSQQDQIAVTILVNVTPAPVAVTLPSAVPAAITVALSVRGSAKLNRVFEAQSLHFAPALVAQAMPTAHGGVQVQAEVSPNPMATLLYSDQSAVQINAVAGTTVSMPCAYHVTVDTARTAWQLDEGLSTDFATGFPGTDLSNNSYLSTPNPAPTPFVVYADDSSRWSLLGASGGEKTYCVDLSLTVPASVTQGAYSTNAVYTLFY